MDGWIQSKPNLVGIGPKVGVSQVVQIPHLIDLHSGQVAEAKAKKRRGGGGGVSKGDTCGRIILSNIN